MQYGLLVLERKKHAAGDVPDEHFSHKPGPAGHLQGHMYPTTSTPKSSTMAKLSRCISGVPSIIRAHESRICRATWDAKRPGLCSSLHSMERSYLDDSIVVAEAISRGTLALSQRVWLVKRSFRRVWQKMTSPVIARLPGPPRTPALKPQTDPFSDPSITKIRASSVSSAPPQFPER